MIALHHRVASVGHMRGPSQDLHPAPETGKRRSAGLFLGASVGALGGIRTPNLLIRSQMLYPLSYERIAGWNRQVEPENVSADGLR